MQRIFIVLLSIYLSCTTAFAQPYATYVTQQNELMVWDKGMIHKIDYMPPTLLKTGRIAIPYLDNSRTFKIYYNNSTQKVNAGFTNAFYATDNLVVFLNQKSLNVFDKGLVKNLTSICEQYYIGDSLVMYLDGMKSDYKVYYNGQIQQLEAFVPDSVLSGLSLSDNIIAYNNFANQFKIFFRGVKLNQEDYPVSTFEAGRSTVAYVDADRRFKIFHNGQTFTIDNFPPLSYHVADNVVAFVSSDGYFKIFYNDAVKTVGFFNPSYQAVDNIVAYRDPSGYFKVFYKGEFTDMENYYPENVLIQYNSLAYINTNNTLRLFTEGEVYDVTNADLTNWQLNYDVINYQIGQGIFKVYYKGTEY